MTGISIVGIMLLLVLFTTIVGLFVPAFTQRESSRFQLAKLPKDHTEFNRVSRIVAVGLAVGIFGPILLLAMGLDGLMIIPLILFGLPVVVVGFIFFVQLPTGRWVLAALVLTVIPLLAMVGLFSVRQVRVAEVQQAQRQSIESQQQLMEFELRERGVKQAVSPAVQPPSVELPDAEPIPDDDGTQPVSYTERVYEPKLQLMVPGRNGGQPDWLRLGTYLNSNPGRDQLTSERFATTEEARAQLLIRLQPQVERGLKLREPRVGNWKPTLAQIEQAGIIEREAIATYQLSVGEFTEPVQEVTWAYDLNNDAAMQRLRRDWQRSVTTDRIPLVVAVLIGMALLFAMASGILYRSGLGAESTSSRQSTFA